MKKGLSLYEFHVFGWFPGLQNLKFTVELVWKSFSDKNNSLELPVFLLYTVCRMIRKNQESCES